MLLFFWLLYIICYDLDILVIVFRWRRLEDREAFGNLIKAPNCWGIICQLFRPGPQTPSQPSLHAAATPSSRPRALQLAHTPPCSVPPTLNPTHRASPDLRQLPVLTPTLTHPHTLSHPTPARISTHVATEQGGRAGRRMGG